MIMDYLALKVGCVSRFKTKGHVMMFFRQQGCKIGSGSPPCGTTCTSSVAKTRNTSGSKGRWAARLTACPLSTRSLTSCQTTPGITVTRNFVSKKSVKKILGFNDRPGKFECGSHSLRSPKPPLICFRPVQVIVDPGISSEMFDSSIMNLMHNVATMYEIKVIRQCNNLDQLHAV